MTCEHKNINDMDYFATYFASAKTMHRMCLNCGHHWHQHPGNPATEYTRKQWDELMNTFADND